MLAGGVEETLLHPGVESDHKIGLVWGIRDSRVVSDGSWRVRCFAMVMVGIALNHLGVIPLALGS